MKKVSGITVEYIYSACVVIHTEDVSVCCDPWFTQGIYDGSWFHFPPSDEEPTDRIGKVDCFYISHIHPDHYDPSFLKEYFHRFGRCDIIIADHSSNYLLAKMKADGFEPRVLKSPITKGNTTITIVPHRTGSISDIDSALIVDFNDGERLHRVLNMNDIILDEFIVNELGTLKTDVDILLCGYTGAGPYPQTYFNLDDPDLIIESEKKKKAFFDRYRRLVDLIRPKCVIPFAGKYVLGGRLAPLNQFRGVADAVEVSRFDAHAVVLADKNGRISTVDLKPSQIRTNLYDESEMQRWLESISSKPYDFERLIPEAEVKQLPIKKMLSVAARRAVLKSECNSNYYFIFYLPNEEIAIINARTGNTQPIVFKINSENLPTPRSEIYIDHRYLFGLLVGIYHWNNAEVGSQFQTRRTPNKFDRHAQQFLNFLSLV